MLRPRVRCCLFAEPYARAFVQSLDEAQERPFVVPRSVDDIRRLAVVSHSLQHARLGHKGDAARTSIRVREANADGNWYCNRCCQWLPPSDYHSNCSSKNGLKSFCKSCASELSFRWRCSLRGFLKHLLAKARHTARRRALSGRSEAGLFELENSALFDLFLRQEGRCAYSGVVLQTRPLSDWQCSLERVDPSIGYVPRNVVLIAAEFQSRAQWSWQKIFCLPVPQNNAIPCCMGAGRYCFCKKLLRSAEQHALHKKNGTVREKPREFSLTLGDLQAIVWKQKGRCAYSNIALTFKRMSEWMASLERLDNSSGYTVQNVALICHEFQSSDCSTLSTRERLRVRGSPQWSLSKATELTGWLQKPIVREWILHQQALFAAPYYKDVKK